MQTCPGGFTGMACIMRSWGSFVLANMDFPPLGESWVCSSAAIVKFRCPPGGGRKGLERERGTNHQKAPNKFLYMTLKRTEATRESLAEWFTWE